MPFGNNVLVFDFINLIGTDYVLAIAGVTHHLEPVAKEWGILI